MCGGEQKRLKGKKSYLKTDETAAQVGYLRYIRSEVRKNEE